ncbi:MAG: glutamine--fructose-6-phosphate transaminase (isomerizing) [Acidimicrobiales bacterium]
MCGIIGVSGSQQPLALLLRGLEALEYRGYDSAGVALVDALAGELYVERSAEQTRSVEKLLAKVASAPATSSAGIGHTRWATHGAPIEKNAHPQVDCTASIAVVHNGIIENHRELSSGLIESGHHFQSETDTEVIAHLIEDELKQGSRLRDAVRKTLGVLRGDFAIAVVALGEPNTIVAARRTSPLIVGVSDDLGLVASDISALLETTRRLFVLGDDQIAEIRPGRVEAFDLDGGEIELRPLEVKWSVEDARRDGYPDFMSKEIHEQPAAVEQTLLGRASADGSTEIEELSISASQLAEYSRVLLLGCGSSYHAALAGRQSIEALANVHADADISSEFRYRRSSVGSETLVIAISQSGETVDSLHAIREARARGAAVITVSNVVDSVMARESDGVCYTHAGPEIGVASTKSHVAQLALLQVLALHLARSRGVIEEDAARAFASSLNDLPALVGRAVDRFEEYRKVAREFASVDDVYFLGRRSGLPIAMEGALKLKELAYVRAEAYPAGEMKHGPISLIEPGVVVVVAATRNPLWEKVMANVEEMRARGATIVAICDDGDYETSGLVDAALSIPPTPELLSPIVAAVATQSFAYEVARARGRNVDRPRNLAKVVTVE